MDLIVKARDLKWAGKRLTRGASFTAETRSDLKAARTLIITGRAVEAPDGPLRAVAGVQSPCLFDEAQTAPQAAPETPEIPPPEMTAPPPSDPAPPEAPASETPPDEPPSSLGRYRTRRLKAED